MYLVMLIEGQEVAKKLFLRSDKLSAVMSDLKKEFKTLIDKSTSCPQFYLMNVPSTINTFESLRKKIVD